MGAVKEVLKYEHVRNQVPHCWGGAGFDLAGVEWTMALDDLHMVGMSASVGLMAVCQAPFQFAWVYSLY